MLQVAIRLSFALGVAGFTATTALHAQVPTSISGTVAGEDGRPLAGALVGAAGLVPIAVTGADGSFRLDLPAGESHARAVELRAGAAGYYSSRLRIMAVDTARFVLVAAPDRLAAVAGEYSASVQGPPVAVNVARVDVAPIASPSDQVFNLLAGRIPGALISPSGRPGAEAEVLLRYDAGGHSGPLVLIDGVVAPAGALGLAPSDIATIEVARGAVAASAWGARAGAGVILITTRGAGAVRGSSLEAIVESGVESMEREVARAANTFLLMDERNQRFCVAIPGEPLCASTVDWATEVARINNEPGGVGTPAVFPVGSSGPFPAAGLANLYQSRPWPSLQYNAVAQLTPERPWLLNAINGSARAGRLALRGSLSRLSEPGALIGLDGHERLTASAAVSTRVGSALTLTLQGFGSRTNDDGRAVYSGSGSLFEAMRQPAVADLLARDTLGRRYARTDLRDGGATAGNPLTQLDDFTDRAESNRMMASLAASYEPRPGLALDARIGLDRFDFERTVVQVADRGGSPAGTLLSQPASNDVMSAEVGGALQINPRSDLAGTITARVHHARREQRSEWTSGGANSGIALESADLGVTAGLQLGFRSNWTLDALLRRDQVSNGADDSYMSGRVAVAWRVGDESWWPATGVLGGFTVLAARGSAGGRSVVRLHELEVQPGTLPSLQTDLAGRAVTTELGAGFSVFGRAGLRVLRSITETRDYMLPVPAPVGAGLPFQWTAVGDVESRAWELELDLPLLTRSGATWSATLGYDRTRSSFASLVVPPFTYGTGSTAMFRAQEGEALGALYGRRFATSCAELPAAFAAQCGDGRQFQPNDDGYLVWTGTSAGGAANSWRDGITRNLWGTQLPGAAAPWGVPLNWGAPIIVRDTSCVSTPNPICVAQLSRLGSALPDWQFRLGSALRLGRLNLTALVHGSMGRDVWNSARHLAFLNFNDASQDQGGGSVETAKPVGYYWRAGPGFGVGYGGLYDMLTPNNHFVESADFVRLRELSVSWRIGPLAGRGDWTLAISGRNLVTLTDYSGFDPDVAILGSDGMLNGVDNYAFPNRRAVSVSLGARF